MELEKGRWQELSLAGKTQRIAYVAVMLPYVWGRLSWYIFDHEHSKEIAIPKIGFGYDIYTGNGSPSLYWFVDVSMDYERRLFGIKREEFCTGKWGKGSDIEINSSSYSVEKILEENAPQIASLTYKMMPRNDDGSLVKYTLLENLTSECETMGLKPFPKPALLAIKKNLDDLLLQ